MNLIVCQNDFPLKKCVSLLSSRTFIGLDTKVCNYLPNSWAGLIYVHLLLCARSLVVSILVLIKYRRFIIPVPFLIGIPTLILHLGYLLSNDLLYGHLSRLDKRRYWSLIATLNRFTCPVKPIFKTYLGYSRLSISFLLAVSITYEYFLNFISFLFRPGLYITPYAGYIHHHIPALIFHRYHATVIVTSPLDYMYNLFYDDFSHLHKLNLSNCVYDKSSRSKLEKDLRSRFAGAQDEQISYAPFAPYVLTESHRLDSERRVVDNILENSEARNFCCLYMHEFSDYHQDGGPLTSTFHSYIDWLHSTSNFFLDNHIPFVIKMHPSIISGVKGYELSKTIIDSFFGKFKSLMVSMNTHELIESGMSMGVTASGTIGLELAYLNVLCCSLSAAPYSDFPFANTYHDLNQLFDYWQLSKSWASTGQSSIESMRASVIDYLCARQYAKMSKPLIPLKDINDGVIINFKEIYERS
jgi:hypothetical protein